MNKGSHRLGLIGLNQTPLDWRHNLNRIRGAWHEGRRQGVQLFCFPELAVTGYGCEDLFLHPDTCRRALEQVTKLATECGDEVLIVGLPFLFEKYVYNGVAVLNRGQIRAISLKSHLAREGIHYEPRWFRAWPAGRKEAAEVNGKNIPIGTLSYRAGDLRFALEICEDAWVEDAERPCRLIEGASWVFNASASHFSMRKADIRENIVRGSSARFKIGYAYTNLVGLESGRAIYDGEQLIAQDGEILARTTRLYLDGYRVLAHDIQYPSSNEPADVALHVGIIENRPKLPEPITERQLSGAFEEFAYAASLALCDYMRKSGANGFTLSLSGGVDSSTVAVLVWITVWRLVHELTPEQRRRKLRTIPGAYRENDTPERLVNCLLTTVYQATRNSGKVTRHAASSLSAAIGANYLELEIEDIVAAYRKLVGDAIGRELTWDNDDVALQNIQARVRSPGVWMLANLNGSLLLSTSNRSEAAVGYATMDGDTSGGLAPIAGVEKTFLRRWLIHMEKKGVGNLPPIPALTNVNSQEPTAELRPPEQSQKDEEDLMPYEVLDALEEAIIARRQTPTEAFQALVPRFANMYPPSSVHRWIIKFCRLFAHSQWKRERLAPAFHLDDRNLDPKTWARYPILSGNFEAELADLDHQFNCHQHRRPKGSC